MDNPQMVDEEIAGIAKDPECMARMRNGADRVPVVLSASQLTCLTDQLKRGGCWNLTEFSGAFNAIEDARIRAEGMLHHGTANFSADLLGADHFGVYFAGMVAERDRTLSRIDQAEQLV